MTLPGETVATGAPTHCDGCGTDAKLGVYRSAAGYYVGYFCDCGPYSRESGYYANPDDAKRALASGDYYRP